MHESKQWTVLGIVGARLFTECQLGLPMFCELHYGIQFQWPYISLSFTQSTHTSNQTHHTITGHNIAHSIQSKSGKVIYVRALMRKHQ